MPLGTAPRRVSPGVWETRTGRKLTAAGGAYWERKFRGGFTDGKGHMVTPSVVQQPPKPKTYGSTQPKAVQTTTPKKPSFGTLLEAKHGDKAALGEVKNYSIYRRRHAEGVASAQQVQDVGLFGAALPAIEAAPKVVDPVAGAVIESLSPTNWFPSTVEAVRGGHVNPVQIGLEAASVFPFGRAAKLGKGVEEAVRAGIAAEKVAPAAKEIGGVKEVVSAAKKARAEQDRLFSIERAARGEKLDPAFEQAGGGLAGHHAALAELKGKLPEVRFDALAHLDEGDMHTLFDIIHNHPTLGKWERVNLRAALIRGQQQKPLRTFEIKLIEKAFGPEVAVEASHANRPALEYVSDIINIPRALMATGDFSYRLRNGLFAFAMHPVKGLKSTGRAMKVTFSQPRFDALQTALHSDPELQDAMERGLALTDTGHVLPGREEAFASPMAERITGGRVSPVRAAGRNFTGNAIIDRAMIYKSTLEEARKAGVPIDDHLMNSAVRMANWATGRSSWGHETAEMLTNTFLFSPKLFKTRVEVLNILPGKHGFYSQLHPFVRRKVIRSLVRLVAAGTAVLAIAAKYGADVELDPRSSDWGKLRVGKTRFDIWGGNQQIARTIAQIGSQATKSSTTGEVHHLGKGEHFDPLSRLFEGKLSPPISFGLDVKRGEMFGGQPFSWGAEARQRLSPLLWQDIIDAWRQEGAGVGTAAAGFGAFGVGTQTYTSQKPKGGGRPVFAPTESSRSKRRGRSIYGGGHSTHSIYNK